MLVNYTLLTIAAGAFCIGEYGTWNTLVVVVEVAALIGLALSFQYTYARSGIWKFFHTDPRTLDEREIYVAHEAFQASYRLFSAITMIIVAFLAFSVRFSFLTLTHRGHYSVGIMLLFVMNYLIHTLPSSVFAWNAQRVSSESFEE